MIFSGFYLFTVIPVVNLLFRLEGLSLRLEQRRQDLLMLYRGVGGGPQVLQFVGYEAIYLSTVAAVWILAAAPSAASGRLSVKQYWHSREFLLL